MVDLPGRERAARSVEAELVKIKQGIIRRQAAAAAFGRRDELSDRLARPRDGDAFALFDAGDEVRKPGLGGVDIDRHAGMLANMTGLIKRSLVSEACSQEFDQLDPRRQSIAIEFQMWFVIGEIAGRLRVFGSLDGDALE